MTAPERSWTAPGADPGRELLLVELLDGDPAAVPVLLSSGLGGAWFDWQPVAEELARLLPDAAARGRVLVMDRPGAGAAPRDDAGTTDLTTAADELALALDAAGADRAVLVGHSMGAWYVEACARTHPGRAAAVLLLDGSIAAVPRRPGPVDAPRGVRLGVRLAAARGAGVLLDAAVGPLGGWARTGPRLRRWLEGPGPGGRLVARHRDHARGIYGRPGPWHSALAEWAAYPYLRGQLTALRAVAPLPPVPVVDVTATRVLPAAVSPWSQWHRRFVRRLRRLEPSASPGSVLRSASVRGAPHMLMLTHPRDVAALIAGLLQEVGATGDGAR